MKPTDRWKLVGAAAIWISSVLADGAYAGGRGVNANGRATPRTRLHRPIPADAEKGIAVGAGGSPTTTSSDRLYQRGRDVTMRVDPVFYDKDGRSRM
jgi:hypothetical protein